MRDDYRRAGLRRGAQLAHQRAQREIATVILLTVGALAFAALIAWAIP